MNPIPINPRSWLLALLAVVILIIGHPTALRAAGDPVAEALVRLKDAPMDQLGEIIDQFAAIDDPRTPKALQALLDGKLFYQKADGRVVTGETADDGYAIADAATGEKLGTAGRFDVKKITLNNALRTNLREAIGRLELSAADPALRLKAVQAMSQSPDEKNVALLRARLGKEADTKVADAIRLAMSLADLASSDKAVRIKAIESLQS
ncbi:MAG: urea ABC transporter permease subunit UrtB, partial [Methylomagnum sp.]